VKTRKMGVFVIPTLLLICDKLEAKKKRKKKREE
jgi:hypothetical protein